MKTNFKALKESIKKMLNEAKCPFCGSEGAYVGLNDVECPNPKCSKYVKSASVPELPGPADMEGWVTRVVKALDADGIDFESDMHFDSDPEDSYIIGSHEVEVGDDAHRQLFTVLLGTKKKGSTLALRKLLGSGTETVPGRTMWKPQKGVEIFADENHDEVEIFKDYTKT